MAVWAIVSVHRVPMVGRPPPGTMTTADFATYLSLALTAPFVAWGFYLLRLQFTGNQEIPVVLEAVTLAMLIVFYAFQFALLEALLADSLAQFVGACLLLIAVGAALYGPMLTSLFSRTLVGMLMPDAEAPVSTPHLGAGERLERLDDFEGALHEYESVARLFPNHPDLALRLGSTLAHLGRYDEAVEKLEDALAGNDDPSESYPLLARLVEVFVSNLNRRDAAIAALETFAARFEGSEEAERASRRVERLAKASGTLVAVPSSARPPEETTEMPGTALPGLDGEPAGGSAAGTAPDQDEMPGAALPGLAEHAATGANEAPDEDEDVPGVLLPEMEAPPLPPADPAADDEDDEETGLPGSSLPPRRGR